ncbi:MAG: hypothetical protein IT577_11645 [Verrucomicrobiae bacterium]|nr:hypothetical protein [Verrucomicrobiae bacterium]
MRDAPWQEIPVSADTSDPEAKAARARLQTALDGMLAQDPNRESEVKSDASSASEEPAKKRKAE